MLKGELVPKIAATEVKEVLSKIGGGMSTKIHAGLEALNQGVKEVLVTSGTTKQPITSVLNHKVGTVITCE
jgi:acetylglutamate kinase